MTCARRSTARSTARASCRRRTAAATRSATTSAPSEFFDLALLGALAAPGKINLFEYAGKNGSIAKALEFLEPICLSNGTLWSFPMLNNSHETVASSLGRCRLLFTRAAIAYPSRAARYGGVAGASGALSAGPDDYFTLGLPMVDILQLLYNLSDAAPAPPPPPGCHIVGGKCVGGPPPGYRTVGGKCVHPYPGADFLHPKIHQSPSCLHLDGWHDMAGALTYKGVHHAFQGCPSSLPGDLAGGDLAGWSHSSSTDLVHWIDHGRGMHSLHETYEGMESTDAPGAGFAAVDDDGVACAGFRQCSSSNGTTGLNPQAKKWDVPMELRCAKNENLTEWGEAEFIYPAYFYRALLYDPVRPWKDTNGKWYSAWSTDGCNGTNQWGATPAGNLKKLPCESGGQGHRRPLLPADGAALCTALRLHDGQCLGKRPTPRSCRHWRGECRCA